MNVDKSKGYCIVCKKFYTDEHEAFGACPLGHPLLHVHQCQTCDTILYFQCGDDYCGPDYDAGVICDKCAKEIAEDD